MAYLDWDDSEKAVPVAIVNGGERNGKIVYLHDDEELMVSSKAPFTKQEKNLLNHIIEEVCKRNNCGYRDRIKKSTILKRALNAGIAPKDPELQNLFKQIKEKFKEERVGYVEIEDGQFNYIPKIDGRECIYICAPSGSGKSWWCKQYAMQYNKLFPDRNIYLFSKVDDDESLDGIENITRIPLDEGFLAMELEASDECFYQSLCLFDDTDTVRDNEVKKEITQLKNDILETGRHNEVHILITSHMISNYKETRIVLNEAHKLVIYPSSGASQQIRYVLDRYWGYDKITIDNIIKMRSRWVMCGKIAPQYYMGQRAIRLIR